ncbi:MAG: hypothetical protein LBH41_01080 [Rickettsiales bacterium]|jgi:hypothetical protein|nr:hypothetical protein [Rickettsiales bacterium]
MKQQTKRKLKEFLGIFAASSIMATITVGAFRIAIDTMSQRIEEARAMRARVYPVTVISKSFAQDRNQDQGFASPDGQYQFGLSLDGNPYGDENIDDDPGTPEFILVTRGISTSRDCVGYVISKLEPGEKLAITDEPRRPDSKDPLVIHPAPHGGNFANFEEIMDRHGTYEASVTDIIPKVDKKGVLHEPQVEFTTSEGGKYMVFDDRFRMGDLVQIRSYAKPEDYFTRPLYPAEIFTDKTMEALDKRRESLGRRHEEEQMEFRNSLREKALRAMAQKSQ